MSNTNGVPSKKSLNLKVSSLLVDKSYSGNSLPLDTFDQGIGIGGGDDNRVAKNTSDIGCLMIDKDETPYVYRHSAYRPIMSHGLLHTTGTWTSDNGCGVKQKAHRIVHQVKNDSSVDHGQVTGNAETTISEAGIYLVTSTLNYGSSATGWDGPKITIGGTDYLQEVNLQGSDVVTNTVIYRKASAGDETITFARVSTNTPTRITTTVMKLGVLDGTPITNSL